MKFLTSNGLYIVLFSIIGLTGAQQQSSNSTDIGTPSAPNNGVGINNSTSRPPPSKYL